MLESGQIVTKTNDEVRCMINGDLAIENYEPSARLDGERSEPVSIERGPQKGDILLVLIDQCRAACEVLDVSTKKGRPLYLVKYDDGMLVQDHLVVPWSYLSTAPTKSSTDLTLSVAATEPVSASTAVAPLQSAKSLGKRRMIDVIPNDICNVGKRRMIDVIANDICNDFKVLPLAPAAPAAAAVAPAAVAPAVAFEMRNIEAQEAAGGWLEERRREMKIWREEERKSQKKYGELLDSIVL
jgi:hypothetical protein